MHTIAPHLGLATVLAARHLSYVRPLAAARLATRAAGWVTLAALVLAGTFLAAIASAARGLVALLSEFVRLAATMMFFLFLTVVAMLLAVALLIHL